jgi:hypothetical protein
MDRLQNNYDLSVKDSIKLKRLTKKFDFLQNEVDKVRNDITELKESIRRSYRSKTEKQIFNEKKFKEKIYPYTQDNFFTFNSKAENTVNKVESPIMIETENFFYKKKKINSFNETDNNVSFSHHKRSASVCQTKNLRIGSFKSYSKFHRKLSDMIADLCPVESEYLGGNGSLISLKECWLFIKDLFLGYINAKQLCYNLEEKLEKIRI